MTVKCNHINKQFYNDQGERKDLACDLPVGHTGDHEAEFKFNGEFQKGSWSDAAGEKSATKAVVIKGKDKTVVTELEPEQEETDGSSDGTSDTEASGVGES